MAKPSLMNQLDRAVEAILAHPAAPLPAAGARLAPLLRIAADLRLLPRADFKARLKAGLERNATMTATAAQPIRDVIHTLTPYLAVQQAVELIDFVKQAFGAEELYRTPASPGNVHAEVKIGDSVVMIGGGSGLETPSPAALHLYVPDADAAYRRALEAGATSLYAPVDQDYGDREASVKDLAGNYWYIATHKGRQHVPEGLGSVTLYLHPQGADKLIDFLKRAFAAEEIARHQSPQGAVVHAKVKIGESVLEMGEAHGEYQPMPTTIHLRVDDAEAVYRSALAAGATSLFPPADQPYGDRMAAVQDGLGNSWYFAARIKKA
jgi:PhnB protein